MVTDKRKRKVLTLDKKLKILELLDDNYSLAVIATKYDIGKSTVSDIKKDRQKLLEFKKEALDMRMYRQPKTMWLGNNVALDKAVYLWFKQKRMDGIPVMGPILSRRLSNSARSCLEEDHRFVASEGWRWRFCNRHGI